MGTNQSPTHLRGFLVPWVFTDAYLWNAQSTYNTQNPKPDYPEPQQDSDLLLTAAGEFTSTEPLDIFTAKAGSIGECGFVWKQESETEYYGQDQASISRWQQVIEGTAGTTTRNDLLQAIALPNGNQLVMVMHKDGTNQNIKIYKRTSTGTITNTTIYTQPQTTYDLKGGLTLLGDGSILGLFMQATPAGQANIQAKRSFDGDTWYLLSKRVLPIDIDISGTFGAGAAGVRIERMRFIESLGQILLLLNVTSYNTSLSEQNLVYQYSSTNNGCSFIDVGPTDGTLPYFGLELIVRNDQFQVFYIDNTDESEYIFLDNATTPLDRAKGHGATRQVVNGQITISKVDATHGYLTDGYQSVWRDEAGTYFAVYKDVGSSTDTRFVLFVSEDGETWTIYGNPSEDTTPTIQRGIVYDGDDAESMPSEISGCTAAGRQVLYHNYITKGAFPHNEGGLHLFELGGWSTINLPAQSQFPQTQERANWSKTWVPYNAPNNTSAWTKIGAGTITQNNDKATFLTTSAQTAYVETALFSSTLEQGVLVRARLKSITEGASAAGRGIQVETTDRIATVWLDTNEIRLRDTNGSISLGNVTADTTKGIEIFLAVTNNTARAWYRRDFQGRKEWTPIGNGALSSGSSAANTRVRFGHLSTSGSITSDMETEWYEVHYAYSENTGLQLEEEPANPDDLAAKPYPPQGTTAFIDFGVQVSTMDSPAYYGDEYKIKETSISHIKNMFMENSRSPRITWRSADTATQNIALFLDLSLEENQNSTLGTDSFALHLNNINFRSFELQRYDQPSAAWVSMGTFSNDVGGQFNFSRTGNTITSTDAQGIFLQYNECQNWILLLTSGETTIARRIRTNTAGTFDTATNRTKAQLILEDAQTTDPTSGTAYLVPTSCTAIVHNTNSLAAIKLIISSQTTPENIFMIGSFVGGALLAPQQYSRGRQISFSPGTETTTTTDGQDLTRTNHDGQRIYRIAWTEGVDTSQLFETNPSPDYFNLVAGTAGVSTPSATPTTMFGLARYLNGAKTPIVYLPRVFRQSSQLLNRREEQILVIMEGETSIEHVLGDEFEGDSLNGEVYRVGTMVLKELI